MFYKPTKWKLVRSDFDSDALGMNVAILTDVHHASELQHAVTAGKSKMYQLIFMSISASTCSEALVEFALSLNAFISRKVRRYRSFLLHIVTCISGRIRIHHQCFFVQTLICHNFEEHARFHCFKVRGGAARRARV